MIKIIRVCLLIGALIFAVSMLFDHDPQKDIRVAWKAYRLGDMDSALRLARFAALLSDEESQIWQASHELQARASLELGNSQYARKVLNNLLAVNPDHWGGLQLRGKIRLSNGDAQGALEDLQRFSTQSGNSKPSPIMAEALAERAKALLQVGDVDSAYEAAHTAYEAAPGSWNTQYAMSLVLEKKGQLRQALRFVEKAIRSRNRAQYGFYLKPEGKNWTYRMVELRKKIESGNPSDG
ncbi:MAG: hypothetical protein KQH53_14195 [Desulfarculaceae bacterium]|nr:hypothetical protein [Desulfarculaceae bacterium]